MMKKLLLAPVFAALTMTAPAQTPSGLTTGPVAYTDALTQSPYDGIVNGQIVHHVWTLGDGSTCSDVSTPSCYILRYVSGFPYGNLQASDGTGNCYTWNTWQFALGPCQTSFHGGAAGENSAALYCHQDTIQAPDVNGAYNLSCVADFDGSAIMQQGGTNVPITTQFNISVTIQHHPVTVIISGFRQPPHPVTYQQIDSAVVNIAPIPDPPSVSSNVDGGPDDGR